MNRKIHLAALWLLLAGTPAPGQTGRTWSLEDCIDHALAHNIQLRRARLNAQSSATDVKEAKAGLLPTLSAAVTPECTVPTLSRADGQFRERKHRLVVQPQSYAEWELRRQRHVGRLERREKPS